MHNKWKRKPLIRLTTLCSGAGSQKPHFRTHLTYLRQLLWMQGIKCSKTIKLTVAVSRLILLHMGHMGLFRMMRRIQRVPTGSPRTFSQLPGLIWAEIIYTSLSALKSWTRSLSSPSSWQMGLLIQRIPRNRVSVWPSREPLPKHLSTLGKISRQHSHLTMQDNRGLSQGEAVAHPLMHRQT